jgi:nodulation protein F
MDELTPRIIEILKPYMSVASHRIAADVPLGQLDIDPLDLPLIIFDIEDGFGIQMRLEDVEELASAVTIAMHVRGLIETRPASRRPLVPVSGVCASQSAWTLSGASRRAPRQLQAA